jgi:hypothetical protein
VGVAAEQAAGHPVARVMAALIVRLTWPETLTGTPRATDRPT